MSLCYHCNRKRKTFLVDGVKIEYYSCNSHPDVVVKLSDKKFQMVDSLSSLMMDEDGNGLWAFFGYVIIHKMLVEIFKERKAAQ